jgi:hypothetical protein
MATHLTHLCAIKWFDMNLPEGWIANIKFEAMIQRIYGGTTLRISKRLWKDYCHLPLNVQIPVALMNKLGPVGSLNFFVMFSSTVGRSNRYKLHIYSIDYGRSKYL